MTTAKGGEFAMVMPVTHHDGSNRARDVNEDPIPTPTGANRGELAFIAAQFGERPGRYACQACRETFEDGFAAGTIATSCASVNRFISPNPSSSAAGFAF